MLPDIPPDPGNEDPVFLSLLDESRRRTATDPQEWHGEPHTLTVHSVTAPDGPFDDGDLDYEIGHPPGCKQETDGEGDHSFTYWTCDVAQNEHDCGLASSLRYSGTPITEPGTYRIQSWGRKYYVWEAGAYEYDGGVGLMDPEEAATG